MIKDLKENKMDYFILAVLLSVGVGMYAMFRGDNAVEKSIAGAIGLTYILWGIFHHHKTDRVTGKIVLEYSLIALFGFVVINSLLSWR